ncbi:MAG: hypothetical protein NDJ90_06895 [Oligoflexia bacterium]|nr:hypothetical protein [Oligoflexia bacterium]
MTLETRSVTLRLAGLINEHSDLQKVSDYLFKLEPKAQRLCFDLGGVTDINSSGLRQWIIFIKRLENIGPLQEKGFQIVFTRLGEVFLERANTFPDMLGAKPRIERIEAPFRCPSCSERFGIELRIEELGAEATRPHLPSPKCEKCNTPLEFDEDLNGFFRFLKRICR